MRKTRLMAKLFSSATPQEYKDEILSKIDEAHDNGSATLESDGEKLQFADVEGDIIVEDQTDGVNEVTRISQNPENENDLVMSEVEVPVEEEVTEEVTEEPTEEEEVTEETVTESDNLESIEIKRIPGIDGEAAEDIVDDLEIEVNTGIEDGEKSGTNAYSLKFKNYSKKKAQIFAKIFAHCADCIDEVVKAADVDEDVQVKFEGDQMKVMSIHFGKPVRTFSEAEETEESADVTAVLDAANDLVDTVEKDGITKENAEQIKNLSNDIIKVAEDLEANAEDKEFSLKSIKAMCKMYAEGAEKIESEEEVTEEPTEEVTEEVTEEPTEEVTEEVTEEPTEEEVTEETVTESESNPQVLQCEESGKWYIQEDPEKKLYDTQEEAEQVAARMFSEPSVTLTVEGLEPASVSQLLGGPKEEEEEVKDEVEPKVDPNDGFGAGRHFSMTADQSNQGSYNNPLLFTEIH